MDAFSKTIFDSFSRQRLRIVWVLVALFLLGISQSALLIALGPLLKAIVSISRSATEVNIASAIPKFFVPYFPAHFAYLNVDQLLIGLPIALLLLGIIRTAANAIFEQQLARLSINCASEVREKVFQSVLAQSYLNISSRSPAAWMSMVMNDVQFLQSRISEICIAILRDGVLFVFSMAALLFLNWRAGLIVMAVMAVLVVVAGWISRRIAFFAAQWQKDLASMQSYVLALRSRLEFVLGQRARQRELEMFCAENNRYYSNIRRSLLIRSSFTPLVEWVGFVLFAGFLLVYVQEGRFIVDGVFAIQFFACLGVLLRPLRNIGDQITRLAEIRGALQAAIATVNAQPHEKDLGQFQLVVKSSFRPHTDMKFHRIDFEFATTGRLISFKDLHLNHSRMTALVGLSGSGKSTLIKILCGLYPAKYWQASLSQEELSAQVAFVAQDPFVFQDSLRNNLLYAFTTNKLTPPPDSDLVEILKQSGLRIHDFSQGLDTVLNPLLSNLSGGQLQRVIIARALLLKRPVLLLDEPTSALDIAIEKSILQQLRVSVRDSGFTVLSATHRLASLSYFDDAYLVGGGAIKQYYPKIDSNVIADIAAQLKLGNLAE